MANENTPFREASRRQLPDELLLMIINAGNMIILLAGRQPDSEGTRQHNFSFPVTLDNSRFKLLNSALVCSIAQAEKLVEIVCTSLATTSSSLNGGIVTVAALTFWTQLVPKLALVHGTRWQDSKTVRHTTHPHASTPCANDRIITPFFGAQLERLLCAASMATFKQHLRGPSMLLRLLASHGLSAFLSLQGDASADRPTTVCAHIFTPLA